MIKNADEFFRLRTSEKIVDQDRATWEFATVDVWIDVIKKYPEMKWWVVHNKKIQPEILTMLSDDPDWRVRDRVASKGSVGEDILWKLSRDPSEAVRSGVISNRKVTKEILEFFLNDSVEEIVEFARKKLIKLQKNKN